MYMRRMKKYLKTAFALALVALLPSTASAQLTLDECQRLARENYPAVKRYELIGLSTEYTVKNINRGYLPQLSFSGQATYQSDVMTLPSALQGMMAAQGRTPLGLDKDQYKLALDLNQTIYDGGNRAAQKRAARAQGDVQTAETDVEMYAVRERVNDLYFGILLLEKRISLNGDMQTLLLANQRKLEAMQKNGLARQSDVDVVRAEYLKVRQQGISLTSTRGSFVKMLALFIGRDDADVPTLVMPTADIPTSMNVLRPELRMFDAQLRQNDAQRKLLTSGILPSLSLFAQGYYGYPGFNMFDDMFDHDFTLNGIVGVRLQWNISRLYTDRNDRRKLNVQRDAIETARETFLFNNRMQRVQEEDNIESYRQLLAEDDEIVRLRTSVRQAAEAKLSHGTIDVNDLLEEITKENQARTDHSAHEIEMLKHIYELKHTVNQ